MRYKAEFAPADLLCPSRLRWVPYAEAKLALDANPRTDFAAILEQQEDSTAKPRVLSCHPLYIDSDFPNA